MPDRKHPKTHKGVLMGGPHHGKVMEAEGTKLILLDEEDTLWMPGGHELHVRRPPCTYRWTKLGDGLNTVWVWLSSDASKDWALSELMLE